MERKAKRSLWGRPRAGRILILAAASAVSLAGIVYLAIRASEAARGWALAAATSPLALRCVVIMAAGVAALAALAMVLVGTARGGGKPSGRGTPAVPGRTGRARDVAADEGGTAAIQMTLLLPVALVIFLIITQAALLFNANMVVHYAGFCAARMATVVVPLEIGDELQNLVYNPDVATNPSSEKLEMIRRAAVLALAPISASLDVAESEEAEGATDGGQAIEEGTRNLFRRLGADTKPWFRRIRKQYHYADTYTEWELAKPEHWRDGDPNSDCPYRYYQRGEWTLWGWSYIPYCPFYPDRMDYAYWEDLHVRVTYPYLLEVPVAGRVMGEMYQIPGRRGNSYREVIRVTCTLSNEGGPERRPSE